MFGPVNSGESLAVVPLLARANTPQIHPCWVDTLTDPQKYPMCFRNAPTNQQIGGAANRYVTEVLKKKKVAVISDTTGYGTASVNAYVPMLKQRGAEVVYQGNVDAANPDLKPELLRMQNAGAEAIMPWSVNAGFLSRIINTRGQMGWDVPIVGQTTLGSGQTQALLEKPEYWGKVYPQQLPPGLLRLQGQDDRAHRAFVDRLKNAKIEMGDTLLWWIAIGYDSPYMIARSDEERRHRAGEDRRLSQPAEEFPRCLRRHLLHGGSSRRLSGRAGGDGRGQLAQGRRVQAGSRLQRLIMIQSIILSGVAIGCIYALIGIAYNVMYSASRVFSFTAGTLGMLGGVLGSLFILRMGLPVAVGFVLALLGGAVFGVVTEIVAVRPVLKSLDQHLYVLSTLALALMVQQFTAIEWSTEPQPFPRLFDIARVDVDQQFWLPMVACAVVIVGLELLYRRTLIGHAFLAIAEDNYAARALGLPERGLRMASYAIAGAIGALAGFAGGEMLLAFFANAPMLTFYGFVPVALGGMGNNRGAVVAGLLLGLFQQSREFPGRRHLRIRRRVHRVHHRPAGAPRRARGRQPAAPCLMDTQVTSELSSSRAEVPAAPASIVSALLPFAVLLVIGLALPLFGGGYWGMIATRACVYWVLVSGLNLVVGFAGQIAIGWVALLTLGAYTTSVLAAGNAMPAWPPYLALAIAGVVGAVFGVIVGLPALRLRTFYFAITTLGFATIVTQVALAWQSVTGGGVGVPGPVFPPPFSSQWGFYYFCFGLAAICTWMTANIAASRFGRALTAIRDAEVAAEASGISKPTLLATGVPVCRRGRRRSRVGCSPRCSPTSRRTPSRSTCRCCSSSPS